MVIRYVIAILIVAASGIYVGLLRQMPPVASELPRFELLPAEFEGWRSQDFETDENTARVLAADATLNRLYQRTDGTSIWLFIAYFRQQQVNAQIHSPRNCIPGGGWRIRSLERCDLVLDGELRSATQMRTARADASQDVIYWFSTHGAVTGNEYILKLQQVKNSILRRPSNAAFVRYNAATSDSSALLEVMTRLDGHLQTVLGEVGLQ